MAFLSSICFLHCVCTSGISLICAAVTFPPSCSLRIELMFMFMILSTSMSGMTNKACPFPGMTKNLHILCLLLCSIFTQHVPNWVINVLLYVFICILSSFVTANCSLVILWNNFCICLMVWCYHHYLCLLYMVLLHYFCLLRSLS